LPVRLDSDSQIKAAGSNKHAWFMTNDRVDTMAVDFLVGKKNSGCDLPSSVISPVTAEVTPLDTYGI